MKRLLLFFLFLVLSFGLSAQSPVFSPLENHQQYLKLLESAKDSLYTTILKSYDSFILIHPEAYLVQIERCKLIENAYATVDDNPKYEESEECLDKLLLDFPNIPEVLLYKSESTYGDSAIAFSKRILKEYKKDPGPWNGKGIWKVYEKLARSYTSDDKPYEAIKYGELAIANNDTLDLSLLLAKHYKTQGQNPRAIEILLKNLDAKDDAWDLNAKGKLLLDLGLPKQAIKAFRLAKKGTDDWQEGEGLAETLIEIGLHKEARAYLEKATENAYDKTNSLRTLFKYDLKYGHKDSALISYKKLVEESFRNDFLGVYRLQLFFRAPALSWSFYDVLRMVLLVLVFVAIAILPYILILPIHYLGRHFKSKGMVLPLSDFRWTLRHFWIALTLMLSVDIIGMLIFSYEDLISDREGEVEVISNNLANSTLFFIVGMVLLTFFLVKRTDIAILWGNRWSKGKSIWKGIATAFILKLGLSMYVRAFNALGFNSDSPSFFLAIKDNIVSLNQYYHPSLGFLSVVLLVPVYEEILFRGIFLAACEKYMKFFLANTIQAIAFALVHQDLKMSPFYFAFGFLAGFYRNQSQSLAPGISLHITNNLFAFFAILLGRV